MRAGGDPRTRGRSCVREGVNAVREAAVPRRSPATHLLSFPTRPAGSLPAWERKIYRVNLLKDNAILMRAPYMYIVHAGSPATILLDKRVQEQRYGGGVRRNGGLSDFNWKIRPQNKDILRDIILRQIQRINEWKCPKIKILIDKNIGIWI